MTAFRNTDNLFTVWIILFEAAGALKLLAASLCFLCLRLASPFEVEQLFSRLVAEAIPSLVSIPAKLD